MGATSSKCKNCKECARSDDEESETPDEKYNTFKIEDGRRVWLEDEKWMDTLKNVDKKHTEKYNIKEDQIDIAFKDIEKLGSDSRRVKYPCKKEKQELVDCLKKNASILKCDPAVQEFMGCVRVLLDCEILYLKFKRWRRLKDKHDRRRQRLAEARVCETPGSETQVDTDTDINEMADNPM